MTKPTSFGTSEPLWTAAEEWSSTTALRTYPEARVAILSLGAPSYLSAEAADAAAAKGVFADVHVINGFPLPETFFGEVASRYSRVITITDPGVAPSDPFIKIWEHYGISASALTASILR